MSIFGDINVANVTSSSDFDFDILGKEPVAFYIIVPDEDKTYYTLVSIIVGLLYKELVKLANKHEDKKLPVQIDFILDEFANCPPLADIEALVSVARSRGMRFHFFIQSFSQLDNVYGKEVAQIILDNCGLVYLKTNTQDTAEAISKRLGKKTIESSSISQSLSIMDYSGNNSTSLMARDLLTPDEVKQLHYKMIIFPTVGYPIIRDTILYNKFKCYKEGKIDREEKSLLDLSYNYFTVEDIDFTQKNTLLNFNKNRLNRSQKDLIKQKQSQEQNIFNDIKRLIINKFDNSIENVEYDECNNKTYMIIKFKTLLKNSDVFFLKKIISDNKFHLQINDDNKTVEIHIKGFGM